MSIIKIGPNTSDNSKIKVQKLKSGFTLIELLVVIAVIGLIAAIALVALNSARIKARNAKRIADAKQLVTALQLYYQENGTMMSCGAITSDAYSSCLRTALSPYISSLPTDPTNASPYTYYICTESSGCNTSYSESRYWVRYAQESSGSTTVFFVF